MVNLLGMIHIQNSFDRNMGFVLGNPLFWNCLILLRYIASHIRLLDNNILNLVRKGKLRMNNLWEGKFLSFYRIWCL